MMFVAENKESGVEMARIAAAIQPDEVPLNTPLRPCPVKPLSPVELKGIEKPFEGFRVSSVYDKMKPEVKTIDKGEVIRRRGVGSNLYFTLTPLLPPPPLLLYICHRQNKASSHLQCHKLQRLHHAMSLL